MGTRRDSIGRSQAENGRQVCHPLLDWVGRALTKR